VRAIAKQSLASLGETSLLKSFWKDVEDKDPVLRSSSYMAIAQLKDINILPILLKEIDNPENPVRRATASALATLKPQICDLVGRSLSKSKPGVLSLENLELSYKINNKSLGLIFTEALKDKNNPLHNDAPFIIMILQEKMAQAALREMLFDSDVNMVASAAFVLGQLQDKEAVGDLIKVCQKYGF
jgi:HEAT repeat protein